MTVGLPAGRRSTRERQARRGAVIARMDGPVRAVLHQAAGCRWPEGGWGVSLAVYDRRAGTEARGAHWTLFCVVGTGAGRVVESYVITLRFSSDDEPATFDVHAAAVHHHPGTDLTTLARTLAIVVPLRQAAVPSIARASIPGRLPLHQAYSG